MRIDAGVPDRISARFDRLNETSPLLGLTYEAQCFAVEKLVLRSLGWERRVPITRVIADVWSNGFSGQALPKREFFLLIHRFMREEGTKELAFRVEAEVRRLIRP